MSHVLLSRHQKSERHWGGCGTVSYRFLPAVRSHFPPDPASVPASRADVTPGTVWSLWLAHQAALGQLRRAPGCEVGDALRAATGAGTRKGPGRGLMPGVGAGGAAEWELQPAQARGTSGWWRRVPVPGTAGCSPWTWIEVSSGDRDLIHVTLVVRFQIVGSWVPKGRGAHSLPAAPRVKQP